MPQIANCTITPRELNGVLKYYFIKANDGYVLHDRVLDIVETDLFTNEEISRIPCFTEATCSCSANYDWDANPREFYAVLKTEVPEGSEIYEIETDHETM